MVQSEGHLDIHICGLSRNKFDIFILKMMNAAMKSSLVAGYFKATSQVVTSSLKPAAAIVPAAEKTITLPGSEKLSNYSLAKILPAGALQVTSGPTGNLFNRSVRPHQVNLMKHFVLHNYK